MLPPLDAPFNARPVQKTPAIPGRSVSLHLPCVQCACGWTGRGRDLLTDPTSIYWYCPRCRTTFWRWS
jgi:hypothetical protein